MFDVERASREKLIAYIFDLEMKVADLTPAFDDVVRAREVFGLTPQQAKIVVALMNGQVWSRTMIAAVADIPDEFGLNARIHYTRKRLRQFGAEIKIVWGFGYQMPQASISALKAHWSSLRSAS